MKFMTALFATLVLCSTTSVNAETCPITGCGTDWLNVPGDFSQPVNYFSMYLLGGQFNIEEWGENAPWVPSGHMVANTVGKQINFTATQFNHIGAGQGTSFLSANFDHYVIASGNITGGITSDTIPVYLDGNATGTLVDNGDGTGNWTLASHMYANFGPSIYANSPSGDLIVDMGVIQLTTNATYSYASSCVDANCQFVNFSSETGEAMNYHTGLAYLVGQTLTSYGYRVTVGLYGQDPVASPVPAPAAAWLMGSGLLGLIGVARRKAA